VILLREVRFEKDWKAAFAGPSIIPRSTNLPMWAVMTFAAEPAEDGWISMYLADDEVTRQEVAAGMRFIRKSDSAINFIACPLERVKAAGIEVRKSIGRTYHPRVNERHVDVHVPDFLALLALANAFLSFGEFAVVEARVVESALEASARTDQIAFSDAANPANGSNEVPRSRTWKFLGSGVIAAQGISEAVVEADE